jgi:hypothetical protein
VLSFFAGGGLWLALGSRIGFSEVPEQNDALNLLAYVAGALPLSFVVVFFGIGG